MDSLIRRAADIHSASGVARTLLNLLQNVDFSTQEVAQCIEKDPALTGRVLAVANSARYGAIRRISSIPQAIALLGRRKLRMVVLSFSVIERLTRGVDASVYQEYWKRSITTSLVAKILAGGERVDANDAYTAGLLADIGILVLAQFESRRYFDIFDPHSSGFALTMAERSVFGFDHAALGARLLEVWQFPESLTASVATHHDGEPADALACVVRAGNLMPSAIWIADSESFHSAYRYFQNQFNFGIESFIDLATEVNYEVDEEAEAYGVEGVKGVDCDVLRREASEQLRMAQQSDAAEMAAGQ